MDDDYDVFGSLCRLNDADIRKQAELALAAKADVFLSDDSEDNAFSFTDELKGSSSDKLTLPLKEVAVVKQKSKPSPPAKKTANKRQAKSKTVAHPTSPSCNETPNPPVENTAPNSPVARRTRRSLTAGSAASSQAPKEQHVTPMPPKVPNRRSRGRGKGRGSAVVEPMPSAMPAATEPPRSSMVLNAFEILRNASASRRGKRGNARTRPSSRDVVAELAARCRTVDYVDLVSSPLPPITGTIVVDSDSEDTPSSKNILSKEVTGTKSDLDISFDEENPEMSVKIKWNGSDTELFKLRKHQKFEHIFEKLAERESTTVEHVVLNIDNRIIWPSDTPHSINYKIYEFITGRVLTRQVNALPKKRDANKITLKIQSELWPKRPLKVELFKTDTFKILYIKCAEELNMSHEKLKLSFDGELLDLNATPVDLEFEGGEAIDLRIKE